MTGKDIYTEVTRVLEMNDINLDKISAIITDGAPAMCGTRNGFTALLPEKIAADGITPLPATFHCIIHQENLAAKALTMAHVLNTMKKAVNFIRSKGHTGNSESS